MLQPLDQQEDIVYKFICRALQRDGKAPSFEEIRKHAKLTSKSVVSARVNSVVEKGWLLRDHEGLHLLPTGGRGARLFTFLKAYDVTGEPDIPFKNQPWDGMALIDPRIAPIFPGRKQFLARICYAEKTRLNLPIGSTLLVRLIRDLRSYKRPRWFLVRQEQCDCIRLLRFKQSGVVNPKFSVDLSKDGDRWQTLRLNSRGKSKKLEVHGLIVGMFVPGTTANIRAMRDHLRFKAATKALSDPRSQAPRSSAPQPTRLFQFAFQCS